MDDKKYAWLSKLVWYKPTRAHLGICKMPKENQRRGDDVDEVSKQLEASKL